MVHRVPVPLSLRQDVRRQAWLRTLALFAVGLLGLAWCALLDAGGEIRLGGDGQVIECHPLKGDPIVILGSEVLTVTKKPVRINSVDARPWVNLKSAEFRLRKIGPRCWLKPQASRRVNHADFRAVAI